MDNTHTWSPPGPGHGPWSGQHHQVQYSQWARGQFPGHLLTQWHSPLSVIASRCTLCVSVWEYSDETRAPGMDVASGCWVKWKECCKLINKSAFIQFLKLDRPGNNRINGKSYFSVSWLRTKAGNYQAQVQGHNRVIPCHWNSETGTDKNTIGR